MGITAGFGHPRKGLVDRIRHSACIRDARQHVVVDLDGDGQLVPTVESHTDDEFVNITEHIGSAHRAVDVDPR
jgi:fructose-1,6-bisphosphatase/sedoheptulose 1,7-bisphosphatase-like protein